MVTIMSAQIMSGQAAQKAWKDGEYDLASPAMTDPNAQTRLAKLDAWKAKFPATDFDMERKQTYLATYQALRRAADVFSVAKEMLAKDPDNLQALTALVIFVYQFNPPASAADLGTADQAATTLLANADKYFGSDKKPQGVTDDQWAGAKKEVTTSAQNELAWSAVQRKDWEKAEAEYVKVINMNNANLQATYQLATAILNQKKVEKLPIAIFHLGRAANYSGAGALDEKTRGQIKTYYEKQYKNYHGDLSDLDKVTAVAVANALPPTDFHIKSVIEIDEEKRKAAEEAAKNDPVGALWKTIRDALLEPTTGPGYWENTVKGAGLPGGANGVNKFKGKLVSAKPELNPKELVLGITDGAVGEVTLKLDAPLRGKMDAGSVLEFEGVAEEFTKDPFMLTFTVEKAKLVGWTAGAAPAVKKAGPPPVAPKKK